jgi:predicted nuclease of predicted toxin-antitoxin system
VKLLFDENLSPRLVAALGLEFPGSAHVHDVDLGAEADAKVWALAGEGAPRLYIIE